MLIFFTFLIVQTKNTSTFNNFIFLLVFFSPSLFLSYFLVVGKTPNGAREVDNAIKEEERRDLANIVFPNCILLHNFSGVKKDSLFFISHMGTKRDIHKKSFVFLTSY